jgi:hypothetical protein
MDDAAQNAKAADTPPEANAPRDSLRAAWRDPWPLSRLPIDVVPPVATLAALAALVSMALNQLALPGLGAGAHTSQFPKLAQAARFSANLAVTAGLITLVSCVSWALLGSPRLPLRRQLFVLSGAGVLAHIAVSALLFDPLAASRTQIYFGVAAANLIGMAVGSAAVSSTRGPFLRLIAITMTALATLNLLTVVLDFAPDAQLDPWMHRAMLICKGAGEVVYLLLLLAAFPLLVPRELRMRALVARSIGFAVLVLTFYTQLTAEHKLHADYALLLYSAQRVSLWLDRYPLGYAVPFCLLLSASVTGLLYGGGIRLQAASGMLLIFSAGYATRAPGRLLSLAIGFMVLARALIALTEQAPFRSMVPRPNRPKQP